jgi:hypothetical protein
VKALSPVGEEVEGEDVDEAKARVEAHKDLKSQTRKE